MATLHADKTSYGYTKVFQSWREWVALAEDKVDYAHSKGYRKSQEESFYRAKFTGTHTFQEAVTLAEKGWPQGTEKVQALVTRIEPLIVPHIKLPLAQYDVEGRFLDVARFCSGEPEHWFDFTEQELQGHGVRHVTLLVNAGMHCGVEGEAIQGHGARVVALVQALELAGCRVKVTLGYWIKPYPFGATILSLRINLKEYDTGLVDLDRFAFAIAHPGALRRLFISVLEHLPEKQRDTYDVSGGYGKPLSSGENPPDQDADIYIPNLTGKGSETQSEVAGAKWVLNHLRKLGLISATS